MLAISTYLFISFHFSHSFLCPYTLCVTYYCFYLPSSCLITCLEERQVESSSLLFLLFSPFLPLLSPRSWSFSANLTLRKVQVNQILSLDSFRLTRVVCRAVCRVESTWGWRERVLFTPSPLRRSPCTLHPAPCVHCSWEGANSATCSFPSRMSDEVNCFLRHERSPGAPFSEQTDPSIPQIVPRLQLARSDRWHSVRGAVAAGAAFVPLAFYSLDWECDLRNSLAFAYIALY